MKKKIASLILICLMSLSILIVSQAAEWKQDNTGYWYQNDDGSYPVNEWKWIDKNNDGFVESYYFDSNGYLATNTVINEYQVNSDGAWVINDVIQTKNFNLYNKKGFELPLFTEANPELKSREMLLENDTYVYELSGHTSSDIVAYMKKYNVYVENLGYVIDIDNAEVDETGICIFMLKDDEIVGTMLISTDNGEWYLMILSV